MKSLRFSFILSATLHMICLAVLLGTFHKKSELEHRTVSFDLVPAGNGSHGAKDTPRLKGSVEKEKSRAKDRTRTELADTSFRNKTEADSYALKNKEKKERKEKAAA